MPAAHCPATALLPCPTSASRRWRSAAERCGRHGRYNVARLIAAHGADAKLTDLLVTLANCDKARSVSVHDRCRAKFEGFSFLA